MRRSSTYVDDFCDHEGSRPARSALTGAISITIGAESDLLRMASWRYETGVSCY